MAMQDLNDLAERLREVEKSLSEAIRPAEFKLLATTLLQAVHELSIVEARVQALEDMTQ